MPYGEANAGSELILDEAPGKAARSQALTKRCPASEEGTDGERETAVQEGDPRLEPPTFGDHNLNLSSALALLLEPGGPPPAVLLGRRRPLGTAHGRARPL
jgi:hypothetical protein